MIFFESILAIMLGAVLLSAGARRIGVPYPVVLAVAGTALALVPNAPAIALDPELVLALFVAPILLDAAFDTSPRDLRRNWLPVGSLVVIAVGVTTVAVAVVARWLVPDLPWAAAVALGAIVAPPDAVAATAVLRRLRPPHRLVVILEGESLLNDATALLIYRLAVGAVVVGGFSPASALPTFGLVVIGSIGLGAILGWALVRFLAAFKDPPSAIILQFITTFGVWILAEELHLSGIITIVVYAMVLARSAPARTSARLRIPSYAVWETTVFVLQTLAFVLIGLQLRPILATLSPREIGAYVVIALVVLATVIIVRLSWVMTYQAIAKVTRRAKESAKTEGAKTESAKAEGAKSDGAKNGRAKTDGAKDGPRLASTAGSDGLIIAWCGMRGIVTLAAAYALPGGFPQRDLILLCAFTVVVGTLLIQGLTLPLLLRRLSPRDDRPVEREFRMARKLALKAAIATIGDAPSEAAEAVRREYDDMLAQTRDSDEFDTTQNQLRRDALAAARDKALELRSDGTIGDDAFHRLEEELDWLELGAAPRTVE
ncbi:Na+/H+ antiporter [Bosea sp. LC85]|uniref:cation:proton antiporter n=1 Tax=Bosea sp. LC85 TaxID=1502851 RepID=UPI0004E4573D|nr:sodium:proton antiporter [Bosea sp. LC85]KFC76008.1 Na+/H+ antiporter [Bosea sp. LC85]